MAVGKSQACDKCRRLKIQYSFVPAGGQQGPKWKAESDTEEMVQVKWLKPIIKVSGMRPEPTTREVLLEHSELLRDVGALEELAGGAEGVPMSCRGDGIGDRQHCQADVMDGGRK